MSDEPDIDLKKIIAHLSEFDPDEPAFIRLVRKESSDAESTPSKPLAEDTKESKLPTENTDCVLEGNAQGLRHAAAAILRASSPDDIAYSYPPVDEVFYDLFDKRTDIYISDAVCTDDSDRDEEPFQETLATRLGNIGCALIMISIPVLWVVGAYTAIRWLIG